MDYERELRAYINSLASNPIYQSEYKQWAFGAVDFAVEAELITSNTRDMLQKEYGLLEN